MVTAGLFSSLITQWDMGISHGLGGFPKVCLSHFTHWAELMVNYVKLYLDRE